MKAREHVPHFEVTRLGGGRIRYASSIWQRRNLLLLNLAPGPPATSSPYIAALEARRAELDDLATELVVTDDPIRGIEVPGVVVADRWGEVWFAASGATAADLPDPEVLFEWLRYVQQQCPECEGESR